MNPPVTDKKILGEISEKCKRIKANMDAQIRRLHESPGL